MTNSQLMLLTRELVRTYDNYEDLKQDIKESVKLTDDEKISVYAEVARKWNHKMGRFEVENNKTTKEVLLWSNTDLID